MSQALKSRQKNTEGFSATPGLCSPTKKSGWPLGLSHFSEVCK